MMIILVVMKFDYGPMAAHEKNAMKGDLFSTGKKEEKEVEVETANPNGKVMDLVVPILVLIICCIVGMIYTGGFFSGADFVTAFSNSDASVGLALGSFFAMVITIIFYSVRRVLGFTDCMACLPNGFKAWSLRF